LRPPVATEVLVVMPDQSGPKKVPWLPDARLKVPWLAGLRDCRTVLAVGDSNGAVRLCDPSTRTPYGTLFERPGRPVMGMIFNQTDFRDLVVVYDDLSVDVWSPDAADGERSTMAPAPDRLRANGHSRIVAVCPGDGLGYRTPILLADRDGTVSMWEPFGVRLSDPLPPDPAHYDVVAVAASAGLVVTAGRASRNLRIWQPSSGKACLVALAFAPEWLKFTSTTLTAGNANGAVSFSVGEEVGLR
jgi:WD40 repeat protein